MNAIVRIELVGGPLDGVVQKVPLAFIGGGQVLWFKGHPYWCETDNIDTEHRASYYPQVFKERPA